MLRFLRAEAASGIPTEAILIGLGALIGLAVLGDLGYHLYLFFSHVGRCLNGC